MYNAKAENRMKEKKTHIVTRLSFGDGVVIRSVTDLRKAPHKMSDMNLDRPLEAMMEYLSSNPHMQKCCNQMLIVSHILPLAHSQRYKGAGALSSRLLSMP